MVEASEDVAAQVRVPGWQRHSFTKFHPKSRVEVPFIAADRTMDGWNTSMFHEGRRHANSIEFVDSSLEPIRLMVERCNVLHGFISIHDAVAYWGGLGSAILQEAQDQFRPGGVDTFAFCSVASAVPAIDPRDQLLDAVLNWHHFSSQSKRFLPLFAARRGSPRVPTQDQLVDAACMMETYVTGSLYPSVRSTLDEIPTGTLCTRFGVGPADQLPTNIRSLLDPAMSPSEHQAACTIIRSEDRGAGEQGAIPIPVYRADIENSSLWYPSCSLAC